MLELLSGEKTGFLRPKAFPIVSTGWPSPSRVIDGPAIDCIFNMASTPKLLLVDDNPVILKALFPRLKSKGYEVYAALDGPEAFSIARRVKLDLILLDIFFPPDTAQSGNTWDAFLIIDWLRRIGVGEDLPIIIMSGNETAEIKDRCRAAGATAFLSKPLDMARLLDTIEKTFSHSAEKTGSGRSPHLKRLVRNSSSRDQLWEHSSHNLKMPSARAQRSM